MGLRENEVDKDGDSSLKNTKSNAGTYIHTHTQTLSLSHPRFSFFLTYPWSWAV